MGVEGLGKVHDLGGREPLAISNAEFLTPVTISGFPATYVAVTWADTNKVEIIDVHTRGEDGIETAHFPQHPHPHAFLFR